MDTSGKATPLDRILIIAPVFWLTLITIVCGYFAALAEGEDKQTPSHTHVHIIVFI